MTSRLGGLTLLAVVVSFSASAQQDAGQLDAGVVAEPAGNAYPQMDFKGDIVERDLVKPSENELLKMKPWYAKITPFGYGKLGVFYTLPLRDENQLIGGSGGFRLAQLRVGAAWQLLDRLELVASLEAAAPARAEDGISGKRVVELRDAYAEYKICKGFKLKGGQFKAPFWRETLIDDTTLPFVTRSMVAEGVAPPEAYGPRAGLSLDRQVGIQGSSDWLMGEEDAFNVRYALAVVNGNGLNGLFNDNNMVTPVGRAELQFFTRAILGLNGYYNIAAEGSRPNRLSVSNFGYGADLSVKAWGFTLLGGFVAKRAFYDGNILAPDTGFGVMASLYGSPTCECEGSKPKWGGLELGVRYSLFEPSMAQGDDQVSDFSAMVGYKFSRVPFRIIAQYTLRMESAAASISNDSVDLLTQLTW